MLARRPRLLWRERRLYGSSPAFMTVSDGSRADLQRIDAAAPNLSFTSERQEAERRRLVAGVPAIAERGYDLKPLAL